MKQDYFEEKRRRAEEELAALTRRYDQISLARGALALLALAAFVLGFTQHMLLLKLTGAAAVLGFLALVGVHGRLEKEQRRLHARKEVYERYEARFTEGWRDFPEDGARFLSDDDPPGQDLDLFGRDSLYQYLCAAGTGEGQAMLANLLRNRAPRCESIASRQAAVRELADQLDFSVDVQAYTRMALNGQKQRKAMEGLLAEAEDQKPRTTIIREVLMWALPLATWFILLSAALGVQSQLNGAIAMMGVLLMLLSAGLGYGVSNQVLRQLFLLNEGLGAYRALFAKMDQMAFDSPCLQAMQERLREGSGAAQALRSLSWIEEAVKVRYNAAAYLLCNGLFLWDFHCVRQVDQWKAAHGSSLRRWVDTVGELEALLSLAVLRQVKEGTCFPTLRESSSPELAFDNLRHPLIADERSVGNSLRIKGQTCVITGSNMSGKTTFMRSIGVNLVLAYAGGPVLADHMEASCMAVFTSMRVEDSVGRGISTFYAEILRVKGMIEYSKGCQPMLALIDEIFKGTNSADRIVCATEAIKRLSNPWAITVVTTHDFELCNLEHNSDIRAVNYHFSEYYQDDEIHFDYRMQPGRCQTTNALQLMRMAGIID